MSKAEKIRWIYSIVVGVFAVTLGIALICVAADIYYSGRGTGVIFTREIVATRLWAVAIPFMIFVGLIVCGVIFPLYDVTVKHTNEDILHLLSSKKPSGGIDGQYNDAAKTYAVFKRMRYIVWGCALSVTLACATASLCYLLNAANFKGENITGEVFGMVRHVLPCVAVMFATLIAAAITNGILAGKQIVALRMMIKHGNGVPAEKPLIKWYEKAAHVLSGDIVLWVVRGTVLAVAVTFMIVGILNGGARDVLIKAINICTECIGLG